MEVKWGCPELNNAPLCSLEFPHFRHASTSQNEQDLNLFRTLFCDDCAQQRTYVEIGALDGKRISNTLFLEKYFNWGGLLIEGHPVNAADLVKNRGQSGRNIIVSEAVCSSAGNVTYLGKPGATAGMQDAMDKQYLKAWSSRGRFGNAFTVSCRPIREMIRAAKLREIHFFSLDVEGAELIVLRTMDWSIPVHVWMIEMPAGNEITHLGQDPADDSGGGEATAAASSAGAGVSQRNITKQAAIRHLMRRRGYVEIQKSRESWSGAGNALFVHSLLAKTYDDRSRRCASVPRCNQSEVARLRSARTLVRRAGLRQ